MPKAFENMERVGVPRGIVGFVLPAGYTFNLDGTALYLTYAAEEARRIMAQLGIRKFEELVGRSDLLDTRRGIDHWKARKLDLRRILWKEPAPEGSTLYCSKSQDHGLAAALDHELLKLAAPSMPPSWLKSAVPTIFQVVSATGSRWAPSVRVAPSMNQT